MSNSNYSKHVNPCPCLFIHLQVMHIGHGYLPVGTNVLTCFKGLLIYVGGP